MLCKGAVIGDSICFVRELLLELSLLCQRTAVCVRELLLEKLFAMSGTLLCNRSFSCYF